MRSQELKDDIRHRDRHIEVTEEQVKELRAELEKLKAEIDFKVQEVQRIKSEAIQHLRYADTKGYRWD